MGRQVKTIFLDCDGVLNTAVMRGDKPVAPTSIAELEIPEEVQPCLEQLKAAGYLLVCVTNKPDVDEGHMTKEDVESIFSKMKETLPLDDICICYHRDAPCFKPKPGLLLDAASRHNIDLKNSYMIGDRASDVAAGQNAGCKTAWLNREYAVQDEPDPAADFTAHSLTDIVQWILGENHS